ncbi:MAG TPA: stimulus-sensing domain-containing protein [Vicinamibacterales bacterium]|nr:stimulus-sensing domain-containing protein [Vicinamibacterales bacterium]
MRPAWLRRIGVRLRRSRIGLRVLAFNLLVLFLPVAGILYLDLYESTLLETQERGLVEQARVVAGALSASGQPIADAALLAFAGLSEQGDSRIRVYDHEGRLVADSRRFAPARALDSYAEVPRALRDRLLYRVGAWLVRTRRSLFPSPEPASTPVGDVSVPPEVRTALQGRYGAAMRPTPGQRSMTMSSAVPVRRDGATAGAVVVSQSTFRILQGLYGVRLRIFEVVLASVAVAALLSALMSATIVRPLVRLQHAASSLADRRTPLSGTFTAVDRRDEIGDLARALEGLAQRLEAQIQTAESFAADVSHEFKNPLASIRTAAEMLVTADDRRDRERFFNLLKKDVGRLERLVSAVRELARLDALVAHEAAARVDPAEMVAEIAGGLRTAGADVRVTIAGGPHFVRASRDRLAQAFDNLVENARSFAPDGPIEIAVERTGGTCRVRVADSGPGIPAAHLERVFERFFTYRPGQSNSREHTGLGLPIARTIIEGYGGRITAANRPHGGAEFVVELPADSR